MTLKEPKFPRSMTAAVLLLCALPAALNLLGVDFSTARAPFEPQEYSLAAEAERTALFYGALRGAFVFSLLEWTGFCIALVTVTFSFVHYFLTRDIITPIVGTALFFSGSLDAFLVLAADLVTEPSARDAQFVPFIWTVSRTINAMIVVAGTTPFLWRSRSPALRGVRYILLVGVLCALASFALVRFCARLDELPRLPFVGPEFIHRPLDLIPLALYLLAAGIVLPRFYKRRRSLFARGLQVSILPHVVAQLYAVSSQELYDNAFNVASALKIVGYLVPLVGLLIDYSRSYQAQAALRVAEEELRVAHEIQRNLLPAAAPPLAGWDLAGQCRFAEEIGGDYFDYLPLPDGSLRVVVADVSGHDPGASLLMANTRAYLRALSQSALPLEETVARLNEFLCHDAAGRRFVTLAMCQFAPSRKGSGFEYTAAGHTIYVCRREGRLDTLETTGLPLGVSSERPPGCRHVGDVGRGEIVLLATDGLWETTDPQGTPFGIDRVADVLRSQQGAPAAHILDALFTVLREFCQSPALKDDVTAVVVVRTSE
jgi:serine phosphatase RsbU (regulator of sigma subunit)